MVGREAESTIEALKKKFQATLNDRIRSLAKSRDPNPQKPPPSGDQKPSPASSEEGKSKKKTAKQNLKAEAKSAGAGGPVTRSRTPKRKSPVVPR